MDINFNNLINILPEMVFCTDDKRYFTQVNKAMIERLGRTHKELINMKLDDVIPSEDKHEIMKHYIKVLNGLESSVETKLLTNTNVVDDYIPVELVSYKVCENTVEKLDKLQTSDNRGSVLTVAKNIRTVKKLEEEIYNKNKELERIAITDMLTGLYNSTYFDSIIVHAISQAKRYKRPLSIAKIDIDKFRIFNYKYGTKAGDNVMKELGSLVKKCIRHNVDTAYRYLGGVMVIFPETLLNEAQIVSERLKKKFNQIEFKPTKISGDVISIHETISIGVVLLNEEDDKDSLLKKVDDTLFAAKRSGGNTVSISAGK